MPRIDADAESLLHHQGHLLLRCGTVAADCLLRLPRRILIDSCAVGDRRADSSALGPSELENHLRVAPVERRLDSQVRRIMKSTESIHLVVDYAELAVGVIHAAKVQHPHIDELGLTPTHTDNPETKQVGSGIDSEYGTIFNQSCRTRCTGGGFRESRFRPGSGCPQGGRRPRAEGQANCR